MRERLLPGRIVIAAALLLAACAAKAPQAAPAAMAALPAPVPGWLIEHMQSQVGHWQASNAAYQSADEPFDRYVLVWTWGVGKASLAGTLYGRAGQAEPVEFWNLRTYWHPGARKARVDQWGHGGSMMSGTLRPDGAENGAPVFELEQTLHAPSGQTARTRHRTVHRGNQTIGRSYRWKAGQWVADREYTWKRVAG